MGTGEGEWGQRYEVGEWERKVNGRVNGWVGGGCVERGEWVGSE